MGGRKDRLNLGLDAEILAPLPLLNPHIGVFTEKQFTLLIYN